MQCLACYRHTELFHSRHSIISNTYKCLAPRKCSVYGNCNSRELRVWHRIDASSKRTIADNCSIFLSFPWYLFRLQYPPDDGSRTVCISSGYSCCCGESFFDTRQWRHHSSGTRVKYHDSNQCRTPRSDEIHAAIECVSQRKSGRHWLRIMT